MAQGTGMVPNKKAFQSTLEGMISQGAAFSLVTLDLDGFHEINQQNGHIVGDEILDAIATLLVEMAPDCAYRVSGDEFGLLLPNQTLEQAFLKAEAIRAAVHGRPERFPVPLTISAGVAQYPRDGKDALSLMNAADAALLTAKEGGRNQVALPGNEEMVMKSCYYSSAALRRLKALAEKSGRKESELLREALADLLRKHDRG